VGRVNIYILLLIGFLCVNHSIYSQHQVKGSVKTYEGNILDHASVIIEKKKDSSYVTHMFTNEQGEFKKNILLDSNTIYTITVHFLGFIKSSTSFSIKDSDSTVFDFKLKSDTTSLSEVIIESEKAITVKKDTIIFNVK